MFERYTEGARRVIFFARYEASQYGCSRIETEHLLLALVREDPKMLQRFLPNISGEDIRRRVEAKITALPKISTSIDLPLTNECKRILAYANEETDRLAHRHIGTAHILLGILREELCLAARMLAEDGLQLVPIRTELAKSSGGRGTPPEIEFAPVERSSIHELVDKLPESALSRAHWMLEQLLSAG